MSWVCDFGTWNYREKVVNVYVAAIRNPKIIDAPSSVADALSTGTVYLFGKGMKNSYRYEGKVKEPTYRGVSFPPAPLAGSTSIAVPNNPSLAGDWVFAAAFMYQDGAYVRDDGMPVENSNPFTIQ